MTLGSSDVRTGLAIVTKRLDTNGVWLFHNHPDGSYLGSEATDPEFVPNRSLEIVQLVRASTAAPSYFEPEFIEIAPGVRGAFVDGGVSPHNNPALALLMLAMIRGYGFRWPTGRESLEILSTGTGRVPADG